VAHLNHTPMDCRDENLAALCQRCHLRYDHAHHLKNGAATRARKKGLQNLFEPTQPTETTMDNVTAATEEIDGTTADEVENIPPNIPEADSDEESGDESEIDTDPDEDDDLTAPREVEEKGHEMQTLKMPVTEERYRALSEQLVAEQRELDAVKAEKKEIDGRLGRKIKNHETVISKIAKTLDEGEEESAVRCVWVVDYTNGVKELRREDTGDVVQSMPLTADEKQLKIEEFNGAAVEAPTEGEEIVAVDLKCNVCGWTWRVDGTEAQPCPVDGCGSTAVSIEHRLSRALMEEQGEDEAPTDAAEPTTTESETPEEEEDPEENPVPTAGARHRGRPRSISREKIAEAFPQAFPETEDGE
jgi:hypothetical protein